eukprot:TRINITY_DN10642_c0_g1_i1.p1 TRINITY_DN10642_c0_g1~~TRINITY_DN10642_c0_g1_i1.p1  ORF type:complete len:227 (+),score=33.21 TRINITY_DN10642_c0_g1_i1:78-683(+)
MLGSVGCAVRPAARRLPAARQRRALFDGLKRLSGPGHRRHVGRLWGQGINSSRVNLPDVEDYEEAERLRQQELSELRNHDISKPEVLSWAQILRHPLLHMYITGFLGFSALGCCLRWLWRSRQHRLMAGDKADKQMAQFRAMGEDAPQIIKDRPEQAREMLERYFMGDNAAAKLLLSGQIMPTVSEAGGESGALENFLRLK